MTLRWLEVHDVRNVAAAKIHLSPQFNVFTGGNGAGKTSLLEAAFLLGRGSSFRSSDTSRLINHNATSCSVVGRLAANDVVLGIMYGDSGLQARINGSASASRAELAEHLPMAYIGPDSHQLLAEGPQHRRRFLDWGAFHVEPHFFSMWRYYQRTLRQRNSALKQGYSAGSWDDGLIEWACRLDQCRRAYVERLIPYAQHYVGDLLGIDDVSFEYFPGWRQDIDYGDVLRKSLELDRKFGHTRYGPHRADIFIKLGKQLAREVVSRGQQKLLVCSLLLAQVALLHATRPIRCVILIDDLASELDGIHRNRLMRLLTHLDAQILITSVEDESMPEVERDQVLWFHVERGKVVERVGTL